MALGCECFRTAISLTLEWLDAGVDQHVGFQVAALGEFLKTNMAFIWLVICMGADVNLEAISPLVLFPTKLTSIGFFSRMN